MGTGKETDVAADEHEGEVDPDVLAVAVQIVQDMMNGDRELALAVASMMKTSGHASLVEWAEAWPKLAVSLAESSFDFDGRAQFAKAVAAHGEAQRGLAEEAGYTREVWHRPPGDPVQ